MPVNDWRPLAAANGAFESELVPNNTWGSANNATVISDVAAASCALSPFIPYSRYLSLSLPNNTFAPTVPAGAVITGIQMRIRHRDVDNRGQLIQAFIDRAASSQPVSMPSEKKAGTVGLTSTISTQFLGGAEDLWDLGPLARDDLDTVLRTIRLVYWVDPGLGGTATIQVYYAQIRVWYYMPGKMRVKYASEWVDAQPYVKVAGVWRGVNTVYIKRNGVWEAQ